MAMTVEQALNFRMPCGKALKDMTYTDWRLEDERVAAERKMVGEMEARGITAEQNAWMHALADRYDDFLRAVATILAGRVASS